MSEMSWDSWGIIGGLLLGLGKLLNHCICYPLAVNAPEVATPLNGMKSARLPLRSSNRCALRHLYWPNADFKWPFKLYTGASGSGLGAVLYQEQEDGTKRVVAFAS